MKTLKAILSDTRPLWKSTAHNPLFGAYKLACHKQDLERRLRIVERKFLSLARHVFRP